MRLIRQMDLTTHEARELEHLGFIVKLIGLLFSPYKDRYAVYVK